MICQLTVNSINVFWFWLNQGGSTYAGVALIKCFVPNAGLMHGSIWPVTIPPPLWQPPRKVQPFGPGVGNCLKQSCPRGMRVGQIKNNFSLMLHITCYFSHGLYKAVQLKTTYFKGKMPKSGWRGINNQDKSLYFQVYFKI